MGSRDFIFGDVHLKIDHVDRLLNKEKFDSVTCTGDWFHNFYDTPEKNEQTAVYLRQNLDCIQSVMGNHDACHRWPNTQLTECPGWSQQKQEVIDKHMDPEAWEKIPLFRIVQGYVVSHAGFHPEFSHPIYGMTPEHMSVLERDALINVASGIWHPLLGCGVDRGGRQDLGGVTWLDWNSFVPIEGVNQIVGHTPRDLPRAKLTESSENYCIDTHLSHYLIIEDGELELYEWPKKPAGLKKAR